MIINTFFFWCYEDSSAIWDLGYLTLELSASGAKDKEKSTSFKDLLLQSNSKVWLQKHITQSMVRQGNVKIGRVSSLPSSRETLRTHLHLFQLSHPYPPVGTVVFPNGLFYNPRRWNILIYDSLKGSWCTQLASSKTRWLAERTRKWHTFQAPAENSTATEQAARLGHPEVCLVLFWKTADNSSPFISCLNVRTLQIFGAVKH